MPIPLSSDKSHLTITKSSTFSGLRDALTHHISNSRKHSFRFWTYCWHWKDDPDQVRKECQIYSPAVLIYATQNPTRTRPGTRTFNHYPTRTRPEVKKCYPSGPGQQLQPFFDVLALWRTGMEWCTISDFSRYLNGFLSDYSWHFAVVFVVTVIIYLYICQISITLHIAYPRLSFPRSKTSKDAFISFPSWGQSLGQSWGQRLKGLALDWKRIGNGLTQD